MYKIFYCKASIICKANIIRVKSQFPLALPGGLWHNKPHMSRWIRFLISILVGLAIGLIYGWLISPVSYVDTSPNTLRIDYKTDYVLMVAESYQSEKDLEQVTRRLAMLGGPSQIEIVAQTIQFAQKAGYSEADVARMQALQSALQTLLPGQGTAVP